MNKQSEKNLIAAIDSSYSDKAEKENALHHAKLAIAKYALEVISDESVTEKQKGSKAVVHNANDDVYIRVMREGVDCPMLLIPTVTKEELCGYELVADTERCKTIPQFKNFAITFEKKKLKKLEDFDAFLLSLGLRMNRVDRGNKARQRADLAKKENKKIALFAELPAEAWDLTGTAMRNSGDSKLEMLAEAVDDRRSANAASKA